MEVLLLPKNTKYVTAARLADPRYKWMNLKDKRIFRPLKEHPSYAVVTDIGSGSVNGGKEKALKPFWNREANKEIYRPLRWVVSLFASPSTFWNASFLQMESRNAAQ